MEFISFAIPFAALVFLTIIVGGLMNYYMVQRGLAFNPYLTYLLLPAIVGALYFVGGFSMWTVKGIVLALILLRASVQDLSERKADAELNMDKRENEIVDGAEEQSEDERDENSRTRSDRTDR